MTVIAGMFLEYYTQPGRNKLSGEWGGEGGVFIKKITINSDIKVWLYTMFQVGLFRKYDFVVSQLNH